MQVLIACNTKIIHDFMKLEFKQVGLHNNTDHRTQRWIIDRQKKGILMSHNEKGGAQCHNLWSPKFCEDFSQCPVAKMVDFMFIIMGSNLYSHCYIVYAQYTLPCICDPLYVDCSQKNVIILVRLEHAFIISKQAFRS